MFKELKMKIMCFRNLFIVICGAGLSGLFAQTNQLDIPRVNLMPNMPQPYLMRDWKQVALDYDAMAFNEQLTGQYLPLIYVQDNQAGRNYPEIPTLIFPSHVGSGSMNAEGINYLPALVGASLCGINKWEQNGRNWVKLAYNHFNKANGEKAYLNNSTTKSGSTFWYNTMPGVFFYQLYTFYKQFDTELKNQFVSQANQWLQAPMTLGSVYPWKKPDFTGKGFSLITLELSQANVPEAEAAGAIGWMLYNAYKETGDKKYLTGAHLCIEYLDSITWNPAYELQLQYGTQVAAVMNAEIGTNYNINKLINWCFNKGGRRPWGIVTGKWGQYDVSGLSGNLDRRYAFMMNGVQSLSALLPIAKYDERYARALAKYALNAANATRLFYSGYVGKFNQDGYDWASVNDPKNCISYESMIDNFNSMYTSTSFPYYWQNYYKPEYSGKSPFVTGDNMKNNTETSLRAHTNFTLYSSSHVGYLGALINQTNIEGILQLDLNATDFFGNNKFQQYLYYNPFDTEKLIIINLPAGSFNLYNTLTNSYIATGVTGSSTFAIPADQAVLLVLIPAGATIQTINGKMMADGVVVDYNIGSGYVKPSILIKSLYSSKNNLKKGDEVLIACVAESTQAVNYRWWKNGVLLDLTDNHFRYQSEGAFDKIDFICEVYNGQYAVRDTLIVMQEPEVSYHFRIGSPTYAAGWVGNHATTTNETQDNKLFHPDESVKAFVFGQQAGIYLLTSGYPNAGKISFFLRKAATDQTKYARDLEISVLDGNDVLFCDTIRHIYWQRGGTNHYERNPYELTLNRIAESSEGVKVRWQTLNTPETVSSNILLDDISMTMFSGLTTVQSRSFPGILGLAQKGKGILKIVGEFPAGAQLKVYTITGKQIKATFSGNEVFIPESVPGIYIVQIIGEKEVKSFKTFLQ